MRPFVSAAALAAGWTILVLCACTHLPPPSESNPSRKTIADLTGRNERLTGFKGIGRFEFRKDGRRWSARTVFAGREPARLRVDLLIVGRPAVRVADDGRILYLLLRTPDGGLRLHRLPSTDGSLKRVLGFPLRSSDLFNLLAGRVPVRPFRAVRSIAPAGAPAVELELEDDQGRVVQRIRLTADGRDAVRADYFSAAQALEFRIEWEEHQQVGGFRIPAELRITDGRQSSLSIRIQDFRPQAQLAPDMFRLAPPAARQGG